jgi:hypothetical protein
MSIRFIKLRRARRLPALLLAACVAGGLALPTAASAMPIDNGPTPRTAAPEPIGAPVPPEVRTVIRGTGDDTLAIVVAGAALLVAMTSAGYSAIKLAPLRRVRRASS